MTKRVAVALSGGIDSAVVAALLLEQGYDVVGITGKMTNTPESEVVITNAKNVADKLGIKHVVFDASVEFNQRVIDYFETSYSKGQTPNPCIMCNKFIKWGVLFDYAIEKLEVDYIATGHYANIVNDNGVYKLYPASDEHKDQLYFLFMLDQTMLKKTLFPLAKFQKTEVKALANKYDLPSKSAKESQDICFIKAPMTTKKYLNNIFSSKKGDFVEISSGKILGRHEGYWQFTIGQRKGIGIAYPEPLYVVKIDAKNNVVYVGTKEMLDVKSTQLSNIYWNYNEPLKELKALVKIRYNMTAVPAIIFKQSNSWIIEFETEVSGITPGQACVLYDLQDGHLLGGGFLS